MAKECTIQGMKFQSQVEAARHFGVSPATINDALSGRINENRVGFGTGAKPAVVGGNEFSSRNEAADFLGVRRTDLLAYLRVKNALRDRGLPEEVHL